MTDAKTQKVKFVGDTNLGISATFWRGLGYRLKQLVAHGTLAHVTSLTLLSEFTFRGRTVELTGLCRMIEESEACVIAITGQGGIGKSSLAAKLKKR